MASLLASREVERGWRGRKGGSPASFIHLRRPLDERPQSAQDRRTPGHWEADLMLFRTYGQAVLTMHERHSRLLIALRPQGKASAPNSLGHSKGALLPCPRSGVRPSPSITAPNSQGTTNSMTWVSRPSSAVPTRHGRREVWRTPSGGCGASFPGRPTCRVFLRTDLFSWCRPTTIPRANAWGTGLPLIYSQI